MENSNIFINFVVRKGTKKENADRPGLAASGSAIVVKIGCKDNAPSCKNQVMNKIKISPVALFALFVGLAMLAACVFILVNFSGSVLAVAAAPACFGVGSVVAAVSTVEIKK